MDGVSAGTVSPDEAVERLKRLPFSDVGDALVDHHRHLRQGTPEAVYGPGKTPEQCVLIVAELLAHGTGPMARCGVSRSHGADLRQTTARRLQPACDLHRAALAPTQRQRTLALDLDQLAGGECRADH